MNGASVLRKVVAFLALKSISYSAAEGELDGLIGRAATEVVFQRGDYSAPASAAPLDYQLGNSAMRPPDLPDQLVRMSAGRRHDRQALAT